MNQINQMNSSNPEYVYDEYLDCEKNPIYTTCKELYGFELSIQTIEKYNEIKRLEKECCPLLK